MKTLDLYIIKNYFKTLIVMLTMFIPISVLVDLSQNIDKFKQHDLSFYEILIHYYDFVWVFGYMLFPIFLFLSVIWFTSKLAMNSEIIAILSSGISFYRFLFPFIISACIVTIIAFFSSMFFVPNASKKYNDFEYKFINKSKKIRKTENIYKQISDDDFIYVSNYNSNRNIGYNFAWESFDGNKLKYKINAQNIRWIEKDTIHRLTNFFERKIINNKEIIRFKKRLDTLLPIDLESISPTIYKAQTLNFFELNEFIDFENKNGSPLINQHLFERNKRWSIPVSALILTIIAVAVSSFKKRGGIGLNLAAGIIIAFIYIFFDKIFEVMVEKSNFSPWIAAWTPNFIFFLISIYMLKNAKK